MRPAPPATGPGLPVHHRPGAEEALKGRPPGRLLLHLTNKETEAERLSRACPEVCFQKVLMEQADWSQTRFEARLCRLPKHVVTGRRPLTLWASASSS